MQSVRQSNRASKPKVFWEPSIENSADSSTKRCRAPTLNSSAAKRPRLSRARVSKAKSSKPPTDPPETECSRPPTNPPASECSGTYTDPPEAECSRPPTDPPESECSGTPTDPPEAECSSYRPPISVQNRPGKPKDIASDLEPLRLFQLFFTPKELAVIVEHANSRASHIDFKRSWKPLTVGELYNYIGCLIYMSLYQAPEISDYWAQKAPSYDTIRTCFTRNRFTQIRRAFTLRDTQVYPEQPDDPWWFRVEPLASAVRNACQTYWAPGGCLAVDESMIRYFGHSRHAIKAPHKPIKQGFKV
jgi:hypothetical protein